MRAGLASAEAAGTLPPARWQAVATQVIVTLGGTSDARLVALGEPHALLTNLAETTGIAIEPHFPSHHLAQLAFERVPAAYLC